MIARYRYRPLFAAGPLTHMLCGRCSNLLLGLKPILQIGPAPACARQLVRPHLYALVQFNIPVCSAGLVGGSGMVSVSVVIVMMLLVSHIHSLPVAFAFGFS